MKQEAAGKTPGRKFYFRLVTAETGARGLQNVYGYGPTPEAAVEQHASRMKEVVAAGDALLALISRMHENPRELALVWDAANAYEALVRKYAEE